MTFQLWGRRHPLLAYFSLTYAISWGGVLMVMSATGFDLAALRPLDTGLVFVCMLLGPSTSGLILTVLLDGSAGLRRLGSSLTQWDLGKRWYAAALLTAPVLLLAVLWPLSVLAEPAFAPAFHWPLFAIGLVAGGLEEIGWTGFATPRLLARWPLPIAGLSLGLVWAMWHVLVDFRQNFGAMGGTWLLQFAIFYGVSLTGLPCADDLGLRAHAQLVAGSADARELHRLAIRSVPRHLGGTKPTLANGFCGRTLPAGCRNFLSQKATHMTNRMVSRQHFLRHATALALTPLFLPACTSGTGEGSYEDAVRETWRSATGAVGAGMALRRELVRCATLAPSSHNTQCWKFRVEEKSILLLPDFSRRTPAVDPDDHHLFVSLGCAVENLAQAALAHGLKATALFNPAIAGGEGGAVTSGIQVLLEPTAAVASALYRAIPERQNTRAVFDGQPVSNADLELLNLAGTGDGVRVVLHTEKSVMEKILAYVVEGNSAQMNDAAFVAELKQWIRFSAAEAVRTGDGLYSATSGNPSVPRWLASPLFGMFFTEKNENDKYAQQVRSSAGIAIFVSDANDKAHWVEAGRCYERFALQATALGIRSAMLNQPVEVQALRPRFADAMGVLGGRPDLVVRFGRGPAMPRSLRRPVPAVMV